MKDEPGAEERFDLAIKNALAMPPKPHKAPVNSTVTARNRKKTGDAPAKNRRPPEAR